MQNITNTFFGFLSRKPTIYLVFGFWALTNALMLPLLMKLRNLSGTMIPDVLPLHNAQTLTNIFAAYGTEGMAIYGKVAVYDIFYPLGYALLFGSLICLLWKKSNVEHLALVPVLAALLDYAENYYLGRIAADVSNISSGAASLTGNLVAAKMLLIGISVLLIIAGVVKKFTSKNRLWT